MTPIDVATSMPGKPIRVGRLPVAIAITPDGKTAYIVNKEGGTVTPIATATNTPGKPIKVWAPDANRPLGDSEAIAIMP